MSVEYSLGRCYGIIITKETRNSIEDKIVEEAKNLGEDEIEAFTNWECEEFCSTINSWGDDGSAFLGVIKFLYEDDCFVYSMDNLNIEEYEIKKFEAFCDKYKLWDCFEWKPKNYLIKFCF